EEVAHQRRMLEWKTDAVRQLLVRALVCDGTVNEEGPRLMAIVQQAARFQIEIMVDEVVAAELEQHKIRLDLRKYLFKYHQLSQGAVTIFAVAENLQSGFLSDDRRISIFRRSIDCVCK